MCTNVANSENTLKPILTLRGNWSVTFNADNGKQRTCNITLPGTIDTNFLGNAPKDTTETTHLTRLYAYTGKAHYRRSIDIPKEWRKKQLLLFIERTKPTWVYIDNTLVDSCNFISTPQRYILPNIRPGRHTIEIIVDNSSSVPKQIYSSSHAYTEDTQTNWNGIIGDIHIEPVDGLYKQILPQGAIGSTDRKFLGNIQSCFRDFHIEDSHFFANGHIVFLRGKHDAAVWPLTGHTAMDVDEWAKYMSTCKAYGINHIRFHSWCPPDAAFTVADSLGIYLQPELPFWGSFDSNDTTLMAFLHKEGENILREYGHHPSFRMMALGNELWGDINKMKEFVDDFRKIAPDKYYTFGSNYYLGYKGIQPGMDYFTTCRIGGEAWGTYTTHTRGSFSFADSFDGGVINHMRPNTTMNFDTACNKWALPQAGCIAGTPIISHETGLFQTYPDYREINKYKGVLYPYNLLTFRRRLEAAGMLDQADDFHKASGLWAVKLYKADIEMDLRTKNMGGFQLLDLQDYPGQGSAYVGILDAFMDSKGLTTPEEWRQWCSSVVPLLSTSSFCYNSGDTIKANILVANYGGKSLQGRTLNWNITSDSGELANGQIEIQTNTEGLLEIGQIIQPVKTWGKCNLSMSIDGTDAHNQYDIWTYAPPEDIEKLKEGIIVTNCITNNIAKRLEDGESVLWIPDSMAHTVGGLFQTDYWNYRMFKTICENNKKTVSPGTLGILTNPQHPIFNSFPTEMHTNWQWFPVIKNSHPLILDNLDKAYKPIVQVIDNIERNHKLGLVMEWRVGKGKLLLCMSDLEKASEYPEGKAFYQSILRYMHSDRFNPSFHTTFAELNSRFSEEPRQTKLRELNNISQY